MEADSTFEGKDEDQLSEDGTPTPPGGSGGRGAAVSSSSVPLPPCQVCAAPSSGYHFGILSCEACKSFYRRTMKLGLSYTCLSHEAGECSLRQVKGARPPCPACRFSKCVALGMSLDASRKGRYSHTKRVATVRATNEYWYKQQNANSAGNTEQKTEPKTDPGECAIEGANNAQGSFSENCEENGGNISQISNSELCAMKIANNAQDGFSEKCEESCAVSQLELSRPITEEELSVCIKQECPSEFDEENIGENSYEENAEIYGENVGENSNMENRIINRENTEGHRTKSVDLGHEPVNGEESAESCAQQVNVNENVIDNVNDNDDQPEVSSSGAPDDDVASILRTPISADDEDHSDMDVFVNTVVDGYDQEQFLSKLFLSQVPDVVHKHLVEEHCKRKKLPGQKPVTPEHHKKVFCEKGIDLAGRVEAFNEFGEDVERVVKKTSAFCMSVPGYSCLPEEDRINIVKVAEMEQVLAVWYPVHFYDEGILVLPSFRILTANVLRTFFGPLLIENVFKLCKDMQELDLNIRENALFAALFLINPVYCITDEGKYICRTLRNFTAKCLNKTLSLRFQGEKLTEMLERILTIIEKMPIISRQFSKDTESMFFNQLTPVTDVMVK